MAYKRKRSPYYQIRRRNLPGYGDTGILSSGFKYKQSAEAVERLLEEIAELALFNPKWTALLDAVCKTRTVTIVQLLQAKRDRKLEHLCANLSDPLLSDLIADRRSRALDRSRRIGFDMLEGTVGLMDQLPSPLRLSHLNAKTITAICLKAEAGGRKRNSVRRTLYRAVSTLLREELGKSGRNRIFDDVHFPGENDRRDVHLSSEQITSLVSSAFDLGYAELALVIQLALQTSADRGVLLGGDGRRGLLVQDLQIWQDHETNKLDGTIFLLDEKTEERSRRVALTDRLCKTLVAQCAGRAHGDPVFTMTYGQLDYLWKRVREHAGLKHVRFKDLRQQPSQHGEEAGIPLTIIQGAMGHSDSAMTRAYQKRQVVWTKEHAERLEAQMYGQEPQVYGQVG